MSQNVHSVMNGIFTKGSFAGTNAFEVNMKYCPIPATVWMRPTAGTVSLLYSLDGGVNYTAVTGMTAVAAFADIDLTGPVTNLKFVGDGGTAAGTWGIC